MGEARRSISDLQEDILVDILHRLPAKCVGQCRCVSKAWRHLLSQPQFIRTHLHRSMTLQRESLVLSSIPATCIYYAHLSDAHHLFDEITISPTRLRFPDHAGYSWPLRAWCHTHGLLLVQDGEGNKLVLNPITKAIKEIPRAPFDDDVLGHGLGYDSASDDYKIIVVSLYDTDLASKSDKIFVYICSLKNGTLKKADSCPYNNEAIFCPSGMFVHGCIHWIAWSATVSNYAVVAFDLVEEKLCNVPLPPSVDNCLLPFFTVAELGGCLCISEAAHIWLMKEYGVLESWTKFTVPNVGVRPWFLCSLGKEQVVMQRDAGFGPPFVPLVLYNLKHGTLNDVVIDDDSILLSIEMSFVESLVSPPRQQ